MDKRPTVSIGIPVYNGGDYLIEAIDSILSQTYTDFELIICDNASTDKTESVCRAYAEADPRIKYYRNEENIGAAGNFRKVFELSKGKYFKWMGHDDICAPELVAACVKKLEEDESVILCYSCTTRIDENGKVITKNYCDELNLDSDKPSERFKRFQRRFRSNTFCEPVLGFHRVEILKQTPLIGTYVSSDEILLGELAMRGKIYEVPESLFYRRLHSKQAGQSNRSFKDLSAWYDPKNKKKLQMRRWKMFTEYIKSVDRVPMDMSERIDCYFEMAKWFIAHWRGLSFDAIIFSRQLMDVFFKRKYPKLSAETKILI
jgi:glycosyltransferase involved in cell wall biosynthesis